MCTSISCSFKVSLFVKQGGELTKSLADKFKSKIYTAESVRRYGPIGGFLLALALAILAAVFTFIGIKSGHSTEESRPLISPDA